MQQETQPAEFLGTPKDVYAETIKSKVRELCDEALITEAYMHSIFESADIVEGPFDDVEDARKKAEFLIETCVVPITELFRKFNEAETFLVTQAGHIGIAIEETMQNNSLDQKKKEDIVGSLTDVLSHLNQGIARIQDARSKVY